MKAPKFLSQPITDIKNYFQSVSAEPQQKTEASYGTYRTIGSSGFNGEKNPGEIGPVRNYWIDYEVLRARSWQLYLESELAQLIVNRHVEWVIGNGLKLQAEPATDVLKQFGINIDKQEFSNQVEAQFRLFSRSRMSDYSDMDSLNRMEATQYKNSLVGGDVLCVLRWIDNCVKVQLIDGCHVKNPPGVSGSEYWAPTLENGNRIVHGIEVNSKKQHVAFWVQEYPYSSLKFTRIKARGTDTDALMAFMIYGSKYRIDSERGMPLLSVVFESMSQMDRYKSATVSSAEERQKVPYAIEHDIFSTGENPLLKQTVQARSVGLGLSDGLVPRDDFGNALADKIAVTMNKTVTNLPLGAHLKALESKGELYFKDFFEANSIVICAVTGTPYEVAMMMFGGSYSGSRAGLKLWEHVLLIGRGNNTFQFRQPIYEFWLETSILSGRISADGYMKARIKNDRLLLEAFRCARFVGPTIPHIDPLKEVQAERAKLGEAGAAIPLTTVEQSTETLSGGDSVANIEQFAEELKRSKSLGIEIEQPEPELPGKGE